MAYTFGGATGDDINWTTGSVGGTNTFGYAMGWFYPTTLTATRGLFSWGATCGVEIDTTTSELRLRTDNTTDGQWTTTGVALALNTWSFIAFALTCWNTGPSYGWRLWSGTADTAPVERTVTLATAPVGNFTGSTAFCVGNKGSAGTLAFQGDIGPVLVGTCGVNNATTNGIPNATGGAISQAEADFILSRLVLPFWAGEAAPKVIRNSLGSGIAAFLDLDKVLPVTLELPSGATVVSRVPTINGATPSQNRCPRNYEPVPLHPWSGAPRRAA